MPTTERFQFFVVTRTPSMDIDLQRVSVTSDLQVSLSKQFLEQSEEFTAADVQKRRFHGTYKPNKDEQVSLSKQFLEQSEEFTAADVQKRRFHGTYKPNKDEVVAIRPFPIPAILDRAVRNPQEFSELQMPFTENGPLVKAILGIDDGLASGTKRFFFQHFDKAHILKPKKTFLFHSGMFNELIHPGVTISDHLTAVIVGTELLFRSFQRTNTFLDLTPFFKEATDGEIKTLLKHDTFFKNDSDVIIAFCNPAMRKKFSAILNAGVLNHPLATPDRIRNRAKRFGIYLQTRVVSGSKKLVFPEDRGEAMKLLQYLAEELYFSDLTEQPCETNSHRPLALPDGTVT